MQQSDTKSSKAATSSWVAFACLFIVLSTFKSNMLFLAPAFLFCGFALYKALGKDPQRTVALIVCIALALGVVGYQLGKNAAIRDNAISSAQTAKP